MTTKHTVFALPATIGNLGLIYQTRSSTGRPRSFSAKLYVTLNNDADVRSVVATSLLIVSLKRDTDRTKL